MAEGLVVESNRSDAGCRAASLLLLLSLNLAAAEAGDEEVGLLCEKLP